MQDNHFEDKLKKNLRKIDSNNISILILNSIKTHYVNTYLYSAMPRTKRKIQYFKVLS